MTIRFAQLQRICTQFGVALLYVFGSRAQEVLEWVEGRQPALAPGPSDVDIGVKALLGVQWTLNDKVDLALALEALLGVNRVDLVTFDEAGPFLAANIIRGERLFAVDQTQADEYDLYVLRRAGDLAPLQRERIALILEQGR